MLQKKYGPRGLKVISVSVDDVSTSLVRKFVAKMKPAFKVVLDTTQKGASAYGVVAIPANYVIGRDGRVVAVLGYDLPGLERAVAQAAGGSASRASR